MKKLFFIHIMILILSCNLLGQENIIAEEYLKIKPYESTRNEVEEIYGKGKIVSKQIGVYDYKDKRIVIDYFSDCNETDKPEEERRWIVEEVYFSLDEEQKIRLKDVILKKSKFKGELYGDVVGQMHYYNDDKSILIIYFRDSKAVVGIKILPTKQQRKRFECKSNEKVSKFANTQILNDYSRKLMPSAD